MKTSGKKNTYYLVKLIVLPCISSFLNILFDNLDWMESIANFINTVYDDFAAFREIFAIRTEGGEWSPSRASAAHGFGRSLGLVVAGGYSTDSNNEHFKSVKATKDGKTFTDLTDMPVALAVTLFSAYT